MIYIKITRKEQKSEVILTLQFAVCHKYYAVTLLYLISVPKIAEITTQYFTDFSNDDCAGNMSEENSTIHEGLICAKIASDLVTWLEPMIQSKNQYLVSSQPQKYKQP